MWILGLAGSHNSAVALIRDGEVVAAIQSERLTRHKRQHFHVAKLGLVALRGIKYCLDYADIGLDEVDYFATCTPGRHIQAAFTEQALGVIDGQFDPEFVSVPHHLAHAEYALHYAKPLPERCLILVCDGSGSFEDCRQQLDIKETIADDADIFLAGEGKESISAYAYEHGQARLIYRVALEAVPGLPFLNSLGHFWQWAAGYCHGSEFDAGKVMGLAPYGDPEVYRHLRIIEFGADGRPFFDFGPLVSELQQPNSDKRDVSGSQHYADLAAHLQRVTNQFLIDLVRYLQARFPTDNLCYSGGVALNGVANEIVARELGINLLVNGSCEDNGTALGAAFALHHHLTGERRVEAVTDFYGRTYSTDDIEAALDQAGLSYRTMARPEMLAFTAQALAAGKIVGWFQGRSEFGPRALGNRSILADPRPATIKDQLNQKVKFRENFRPFAPVVLEDRADELFELRGAPSPVMLRVVPVKAADLPGITHVDGSGRVQTVNPAQNAILCQLLASFEQVAGVPVLLNTSFNLAGQPIVEAPRHAIETFLGSGMDVLIMGDTVVEKTAPGAD